MRRAGRFHLPRHDNCPGGVVRAGTSDHGHPPGDGFDRDLDYATMFGAAHRRRFAGGATWHDEMDPFGNLPLDETTQRSLVHFSVALERGDQGGAAARQGASVHRASSVCRSTSLIVKTPPPPPFCPCSHSAADIAPSANTRRSRASCTRRSCSNAASITSSCVPGTCPVRILVMGTSRP